MTFPPVTAFGYPYPIIIEKKDFINIEFYHRVGHMTSSFYEHRNSIAVIVCKK